MKRYFCNGCGESFQPGELKRVRFTVSLVSGAAQPAPGLKPDPTLDGDLCTGCVAAVERFVGEQPTQAGELVALSG